MFSIKKNNIDFNCYPAKLQGDNEESFVCLKNKNIETFENNRKPLYIAVGDNNKVGYSKDGINWTKGVLGDGCGGDGLHSVAYDGKSLLIAAAYSGSNQSFISSTDGMKWVPVPNANKLMTATIALKYLNNTWYAMGFISSINDKLNMITSTDGINWNVVQNAHVATMAYGKGVYTALRDERDGKQGHIAWSRDAVNWTKCDGFTERVWRDGQDILFNGSMFVAVFTDYGNSHIAYSNDGITWNKSESGNANAHNIGRGVGYGNDMWVAAYSDGRTPFLTSKDGNNWTVSEAAKGVFNHGMHAHWIGDKWLLAGNGGVKLATTTDFNNFNRIDSGLFATQCKQIITFYLTPIEYPDAKCNDSSVQVGFTCYPKFLINK